MHARSAPLKSNNYPVKGAGVSNIEITASDSWYNKPTIYFSQYRLNVQRKQERNFKTLQNLFFSMMERVKKLIFYTLDLE